MPPPPFGGSCSVAFQEIISTVHLNSYIPYSPVKENEKE